MARGPRKTALGWGEKDLNLAVPQQHVEPATRSAVREITAASSRSAVPATEVVTPAQDVVVPPAHSRSGTIMGIGGDNNVAATPAFSPAREKPTVVANLETENGVHREHAKIIYKLLLDLGMNETVAFWIAGGKPVPEGHREPTLVLLRKGNVDAETIETFKVTGCISAIPQIVQPKPRVRSGTTEIDFSVQPEPPTQPLTGPDDLLVVVDQSLSQSPDYLAALDGVDRDRDTDPLIESGKWKTRLLIAGIVAAGLGGIVYGLTQISDNLTHSVSAPRR